MLLGWYRIEGKPVSKVAEGGGWQRLVGSPFVLTFVLDWFSICSLNRSGELGENRTEIKGLGVALVHLIICEGLSAPDVIFCRA